MHFDNLEAYLAFEVQLRSFGQEPNAEMLAEKARLEAAQNVNEDEYVFGTMAAHNKFMTPEKEKVVREMTDQLMMEGENATQPCLLLERCSVVRLTLSLASWDCALIEALMLQW